MVDTFIILLYALLIGCYGRIIMFKWNIKSRLIVTYLVLIVLTMSLLSTYLLWFFYQHNIEILTSSLLSHARVTEQFLEDYMNNPLEKASIDHRVKELATKNDLRITVIDRNGVVIADSWENPYLMENHLERPEIVLAMTGSVGNSTRYSTTINQNMLYVAIPIWRQSEEVGTVRIASTLAAVDAGFRNIKSTLLITTFLISLLAIALSIRLAQKYTAPLEEITTAARQIGNGDLKHRLHIRTGDELELLAHTLNHLASNLDDKINESIAETQKLSLILEHMDNAVILLDRYGRLTTANKKALDIFDMKDSVLNQHNMQAIGNSQLDRSIHETIANEKDTTIYLKTNIHGSKKVFQVFLAPITATENDITGVLTVFHDITTLQDIHERQADFVANASHELATPLTAIKGFAETLLDGAIEDAELSVKFVNIIHNEAKRMQRLVNELLQLAKLNSQEYRQQVKLETTDLIPLLHVVKNSLTINANEKQIRLNIDAPSNPICIMANPDWLKQVLINLVDNSIKYTLPSGTVKLKCYQENKDVILLVEDSGIGIPPADLPLIFDRFYRVDKARSRNAGGTGLGLAIVKFIVEMHNGHIEVQSTVNKGTIFTIKLPSV